MSDSSSSSHCQQCGAATPNAPEGLCPRCLMAQVMQPTQAGPAAGAMPPLTPEEIAPHFPQLEILECLGRGGMGVVYKARQKSLNRLVALKLLAPERADDLQFAARFEKEAHALAALNHPHIVGVHDFGQAGGFYYLLMEFVDGVNLRQLLQTKRLTPKEALSIVPPVCEALQCAHDHGIVHRDIKPENLLIDKTGKVKIADFGVAKMLGSTPPDMAASAPTHEAASVAFGTPDYAAPEQAHGQADHRADIYSLGVVLYEMLTGERPKDKIVPPSKRVQVDIHIDEIVLRALEKTPDLRFATAAEFRTQVEAVTKETPPPAVAGWSPPEGGWGWLVGKMFGVTFRSRRAFLLANLSALGFLAFLGFVPLPGWQGFFGFAGFFGLIGVAFLVEMSGLSRTREAGGANRVPAPGMNPWPRRIFILLAVLVIAPVVLFLGLLVPLYQSTRVVARETRLTNEAKQREIERARAADEQAQTATIEGTLLDKDGKPVASREIVLIGDHLGPGGSIHAATHTDSQGRFTFKDVSTQHAWSFSIDGRPDHPNRTPPDRFAAPTTHRITLEADGDRLMLVVLASKTSAIGMPTLTLKPVVLRYIEAARARDELVKRHAQLASALGSVNLERNTISLITASPAFEEALRTLEELDQRPDQVVLQCEVKEVEDIAKVPEGRTVARPSVYGLINQPAVFNVGKREADGSGLVLKVTLNPFREPTLPGQTTSPRISLSGIITESPGSPSSGEHATLLETATVSSGGTIEFTHTTLGGRTFRLLVTAGWPPARKSSPTGIKNSLLSMLGSPASTTTIKGTMSDAELKKLSWHEFDQTPGKYWRELAEVRRFKDAAELIEKMLSLHPGLDRINAANLHFHAGQCWAMADEKEPALNQLKLARHPSGTTLGMRWNDYVRGTEAFLKGDKRELLNAHESLAESDPINKPNLCVLDRLLAGFGMPYAAAYETGGQDPKKLSVECFNRAWELLDKENRTPGEDERMTALAHASLAHWRMREDCTDRHLSIGYWQLSRVYAVLGQGDNAERYGGLCLRVSGKEPPFYLGYAHEALARAALLNEQKELFEKHLNEAKTLAAKVVDADERKALEDDLAQLIWNHAQ